MSVIINVGISDLNVTAPPGILATYALGSCVGICLYDKSTRISGLAHIMLPWSTEAVNGKNMPRRYADTGIAELVNTMNHKGAKTTSLIAKIAGGAQMFNTISTSFNIGERNVQAVKKILMNMHIPIVAEQTGENFGRTVFFNSETGLMEIKSATKPTVIL